MINRIKNIKSDIRMYVWLEKGKLRGVKRYIRDSCCDYKYKRGYMLLIKGGYILDNGEPIKCTNCRCKELDSFDKYYEDYYVVEYSVKCKNCGRKLGTWAYGNWE